MNIILLTAIFLVCVNTQLCCDLLHHKPNPGEEDGQVQDLLISLPDPLRPHHLQGGISTQEGRSDLGPSGVRALPLAAGINVGGL